jgi:hypothetical protein
VLARKLKQPEGPSLFLVRSEAADHPSHGDLVAHRRLCLRMWQTRRAWAGRALIAISFPMAYLLVMLSMGTSVPPAAARVVVWLWLAALAGAAVCAEAVWRNRMRLDSLETRIY